MENFRIGFTKSITKEQSNKEMLEDEFLYEKVRCLFFITYSHDK